MTRAQGKAPAGGLVVPAEAFLFHAVDAVWQNPRAKYKRYSGRRKPRPQPKVANPCRPLSQGGPAMTKHFGDWNNATVRLLYMTTNDPCQSFLHGERQAGVRGELQQVWVTSGGIEWTVTPRASRQIRAGRKPHISTERFGNWKRWSTGDFPIMPPGFLYSRMSAIEVVWWRRMRA
jgi:hypothetical protein